VVSERSDRIYLTPNFDTINPNLQRMTMIHELAHWVGSRSGSGAVPEIATVDEPLVWTSLTSSQRLHTADSYGFFATECNVGTARAVVDCSSNYTAIPLFPSVEASWMNPNPVITIPANSEAQGNFDYPAGAAY
jgi:hypothetical protein